MSDIVKKYFVPFVLFTCVSDLTAAASTANVDEGRTPVTGTGMRFEPKWRTPTDCGATSLFVLARLLEIDISIERVLETVRVDPERGTSAAELREACIKLGVPSHVHFMKPSTLRQMSFPLIAHTKGSVQSGTGHFLVIVGYSGLRKQYSVVATDSGYSGWVPEATIESQYSGYSLVPDEVIESQKTRTWWYVSTLVVILNCVVLWIHRGDRVLPVDQGKDSMEV